LWSSSTKDSNRIAQSTVNVLQPSYRYTRNEVLSHDWSRRDDNWIDVENLSMLYQTPVCHVIVK
jgi:hypothetical protein